MMGRLPHLTGFALCLALLCAQAQAADVVCASQSAGYRFCRADTSRGVALIEQLSPFACNKDNTWGFDKGGIWVSNGCAARFGLGPSRQSDELEAKAQGTGAEALARDMTSGGRAMRRAAQAQKATAETNADQAGANAPVSRAANPAALGQASRLVCESKQYRLQRCPVPVRSHVQLNRKLGRAECRFNATWGYDYGEIWVTDGCRAEFLVY
jgi:hypothetical protein